MFCAFLFFDTQPARYATTGFSVFFVCFVPFWVFSDLSKQITPPPPFWLASLPLSNRTIGSRPLAVFEAGIPAASWVASTRKRAIPHGFTQQLAATTANKGF